MKYKCEFYSPILIYAVLSRSNFVANLRTFLVDFLQAKKMRWCTKNDKYQVCHHHHNNRGTSGKNQGHDHLILAWTIVAKWAPEEAAETKARAFSSNSPQLFLCSPTDFDS